METSALDSVIAAVELPVLVELVQVLVPLELPRLVQRARVGLRLPALEDDMLERSPMPAGPKVDHATA